MALIEKKEKIKKEKEPSMKLNKKRLIKYISDITYDKEEDVGYYLNSIFFGIMSALNEGYEVPIGDFGKFYVKERAINNPSIGFTGNIKKIFFKPTKKFKKTINNKEWIEKKEMDIFTPFLFFKERSLYGKTKRYGYYKEK